MSVQGLIQTWEHTQGIGVGYPGKANPQEDRVHITLHKVNFLTRSGDKDVTCQEMINAS